MRGADVRVRRRVDGDADRSRRLVRHVHRHGRSSGASLTVRARGPGSGRTHRAGSPVLSIDSSSFFVDPTSSVLHRYDGDASDVPAIDDVVAMEVRYYGATQPPVWPRPPAGEANCLYDAAGAYQSALMPVLAGVAGLVEMTGAMLSDGPWCGSGGTRFDADLLRVRRIRISVRLQASDPAVRGSDRQRFFNPGSAGRRRRWFPTSSSRLTPRRGTSGGEQPRADAHAFAPRDQTGSALLPVMLLMFLFSAIAIGMVVVVRIETTGCDAVRAGDAGAPCG